MGTGELGKWAWLIALWVSILAYLLAAFGVDFLMGGAILAILAILAVLGGIFHLAGMDRTAFFIAAAALGWFAAEAMFGIGTYVQAIVDGGAFAATAGAVGVLLKMLYEWVMP
jgi:hypothetical protein